jgi:hypothetical protein
MSVAQQLIYKVKKLGIHLEAQNDQLIVKAPASVWTAEIKQAVSEHKAEIIRLMIRDDVQASSEHPINIKAPTNAYITQRMAELELTKQDVRGETDPSLALDPDELNDIRNDKQLFDIWVEHVHRHKQLKALELAKQKQAEQYTLGDTLGSLPFDHKIKFVEHVLITFKKFFLGERYLGQKPNHLFCEMWFLRNEDLTLRQIFDASAELIRLAKMAKVMSDNTEFKRLRSISENLEYFRGFCLSNAENTNNEVSH